MILDCLYESFTNLENALRCSQNERIKSSFDEFERCVKKTQQDIILQKIIVSALAKTFVLGVWSQVYFEDKIIEQFDYLLSHIYETHQAITIKVSFQNHPQHLYRIIKLPYMMKLDDFCYGILASLNIQECKQFSLEVNQLSRYGCGQEIGDNEMDQFLSTYHIHQDSQMKLYYDFDQTYTFDIEIISIENDPIDGIEFIEGNGYGIWENGIDYLDLYYQDQHLFNELISHKGLEIQDFFVDKFDLDDMNSHILDDIEMLKMKYSIKYEERKLFYEYLPFFIQQIKCRKISFENYIFFCQNSVI